MIEVWPELAWRLGVLALLAAAPLVRLILRRRQVLAAEGDGKLIAWFRYCQAYRVFFVGGWLAWAAVVYGLRLDVLAGVILGGGLARNLAMAVLLPLPLALTFLAAHTLTRPVVRHVQGPGFQEETLRDALGFVCIALLPTSFVILAVVDEYEKTGLGWWWFAGWFLCLALGRLVQRKGTALVPQALSMGDLRDRIFELAGRAGVPLQEVYVLPAARIRFANAFATEGNHILFTDFLLEHLTRREVAAIGAHELDHLRQRRKTPWGLFLVIILLFLIVVFLLVTVDWLIPLAEQIAGEGPVEPIPLLLLGWVIPSRFHSRRQERKADAGSAELTGDPEALISALVRLSRLTLLPMRWSFLDEALSTHPSTVRRCEALAARFGIARERLEQLLAGEGLPDTVEGDRFELPPAVLAPDRLFTTQVKARAILALSWMTFLVAAGFSLGTAFVVRLTGLHGWMAWTAYLAGLILATAAAVAAADRLSVLGYAEVGKRLAARLEAEGLSPGALGAAFTGFGPHPEVRLYEGHTVWDLGFVYLGADELVYVGDQVRFRIPHGDVLAVRPGRHPGFWLPLPDLCVDWRGPDGTPQRLRLRNAAGSLLAIRQSTRLLGRRLEDWITQGGGSELPDALRGLPLPPQSEVTSQPLRESVTFRKMFFGFLFYLLVTLGLGMSLDLEIEALRAALAAGVFVPIQYLPHLRMAS
jgi:Zn-dependent protease with chaperone function